MSDMATKLKGMYMAICDGFLVHFILTSLPNEFGPFKISYNTKKEKWSITNLISYCVEEEETWKAESLQLVNGISHGLNKRKHNGDSSNAKKKLKFAPTDESNKLKGHKPQREIMCLLCKKEAICRRNVQALSNGLLKSLMM
jgi:hypothetical protein